MDYLLEILAFFGALVSVMGMVTCMSLKGFARASEASPIESEEQFYQDFEKMKNPFFETQQTKDPSLKLAEEMDKEKDRMDV